MFLPEKLLEPTVIETKFGNLQVTHRLQYVESINPLLRVPCVLKTVFGIVDAAGEFVVCPNAQPQFDTLDSVGFSAFIAKTLNDFSLSVIAPACAERAAELVEARKDLLEKLRLQNQARAQQAVADKKAAAVLAKATAQPVKPA